MVRTDDRVSVVLVDDSVDVRTLVRMRLEASGLFDVVGEAANGEEAIELVIRHEPEAVVLDVSMPAMDGVETLPSILAVRPDTAVVMFTGFGGADLAEEVRSLGASGFIEKSIPLELLPDRLHQILRGEGSAEPAANHTLELVDPAGEGQVDVAQLEQSILDEHLEGFRALFDHAAIGMATLTVHATIVRANGALANLMSCEPSELVGVDYGRLTGGQGDVLDHRLEALSTSQESVATFEHPIPGPPGAKDVRTALVTLVPIRDSVGQMLYVFAQVQDITAQRAAEDELHRTEETFRLLVAAVGSTRSSCSIPTAWWPAGTPEPDGSRVITRARSSGSTSGSSTPRSSSSRDTPSATSRRRSATGRSPRRVGACARTAAGSGPASSSARSTTTGVGTSASPR